MTDGLKTLAGSVMRRGLMQFTHTPISGVWTGALATAVLQSSSATTVATVGFVSAGLIPSLLGSLGDYSGSEYGHDHDGVVSSHFGIQAQTGHGDVATDFCGH